MDNERERLIELQKSCCADEKICQDNCLDCMTDHLLSHGVTVQRWIPVTERLPDIVETKRSYRNVYRSSGRVLCACLQADGKRMVKEGYMKMINDDPNPNWKIPGTIHSVTHWMPLPHEPEEEA